MHSSEVVENLEEEHHSNPIELNKNNDINKNTLKFGFIFIAIIRTLNAGMQTVNGYTRTYHPAQNSPMNIDMTNRMSQIINQSGFFILYCDKNPVIREFVLLLRGLFVVE